MEFILFEMGRLYRIFFCLMTFFGDAFGVNAADKLSEKAVISLITCSPGTELYSIFGHSALRVADPEKGIDSVYNYGTFDFNEPNFYLKFSRGKLNYILDRQYWPYFQYEYLQTNRWIKEQVLLLNQADKQKLYDALEVNFRPQNRSYRYDFFYDNCATRIRDILKVCYKDRLNFNLPEKTGTSFRSKVEDCTATLPWSKFGISIALGWPYEKEMVSEEIMFLPDDLLYGFSTATLDGRGLCGPTVEILPSEPEELSKSMLPVFVTGFIFMLLSILTHLPFLRFNFIGRSLTAFLLFISGAGGIMVLLLWFATDHQATKFNPDLLWLIPVNVYAAFSSKIPALYFKLCMLSIAISILFVLFGPLPFYYLPFQVGLILLSYRRVRMAEGNID